MDKLRLMYYFKKNKFLIRMIGFISLMFFLSFLFNVNYPIITISILMALGVSLFYIFFKKEGSLFCLPGIFSFIWFTSLALSQFRLNINQIPFMARTWFIIWLTYISFLIGYETFHNITHINKKVLPLNRERLLTVIYTLFFVSLCCFFIEWIFSSGLPLFSNDPASYLDFSISGVHYFVVSCVLLPPLILLFLHENFFINKIVKFVLSIILIFSFLVPILIVSRQLLLLGIFLFLVVYIQLNKKYEFKILILIFCVSIICFMALSFGRNQDSDYLKAVFNVQNDYTNHSYNKDFKLDSKKEKIYFNLYEDFDSFNRVDMGTLPMPLYQIYMYISFNFDNLNHIVASELKPTYGTKSLYPLLALTGIRFVFPSVDTWPVDNYLTTFNTSPICTVSYIDFGEFGVFIYLFIVGLLSKLITINKKSSLINTIIYSLFAYSFVFSFFTSFFSNVTTVFYFGILFLISFYLVNDDFIIFKFFDMFILKPIIRLTKGMIK